MFWIITRAENVIKIMIDGNRLSTLHLNNKPSRFFTKNRIIVSSTFRYFRAALNNSFDQQKFNPLRTRHIRRRESFSLHPSHPLVSASQPRAHYTAASASRSAIKIARDFSVLKLQWIIQRASFKFPFFRQTRLSPWPASSRYIPQPISLSPSGYVADKKKPLLVSSK